MMEITNLMLTNGLNKNLIWKIHLEPEKKNNSHANSWFVMGFH